VVSRLGWLGPIAALAGAGLLVAGAIVAAPHQSLDRTKLTPAFEETFAGGRLDLWNAKTNPHGRWKPNLISGTQSGARAIESRTLTPNADKQVWVDPAFPGLAGKPLGLNPFTVSDGLLIIRGWPTPAPLKAKLWGYPYVTGMISTERSFHQLYGYFEIDAEWPEGHGAHPGFWLLPTDGAWPPELDVVEEIGNTDEAWFTIHFKGTDGKPDADSQRLRHVNSGDRFTRFGMLWTHDIVAWYQDNRLIRMIRNPGMDKPCYILATLEMGDIWPGPPTASTRWPMQWKIRAIRAYALKQAI